MTDQDDGVPGPDTFHVLPIGDTRGHIASESCWCAPVMEEVFDRSGQFAGWLYTHNSADGREMYESGARKPH